MTENTLPGVDYETRLKVLERAYNRLASINDDLSAWDYYVARGLL
jgi:hypothetical protein